METILTILRRMRGKRAAYTIACALMAVLLMTGCGQSGEKPVGVDLSSEDMQDGKEEPAEAPSQDPREAGLTQEQEKDHQERTDGDSEEDAKPEENTKPEQEKDTEDDSRPGDEAAGQQAPASEDEELTGSVRNVGQDSFVVSKTTTYHEEDAQIEVGTAPGAPGEELITVYVDENCTYQYKTVKNAGINPEDISAREGSFADMKEGLSVIIKGGWRDGSFYADSMVMMEMIR